MAGHGSKHGKQQCTTVGDCCKCNKKKRPRSTHHRQVCWKTVADVDY